MFILDIDIYIQNFNLLLAMIKTIEKNVQVIQEAK